MKETAKPTTRPKNVLRVRNHLIWRHANWIGYLFIFGTLILAGLLFQNVVFGRWLLVGYGIVALLFRVASEDTFKMMLITLFCIPILAIMQDKVLAKNFAEYAFLLLCIGVACEFIEQARLTKLQQKSDKKT